MKRVLLGLCAAVALAGCASDDYGFGGGRYGSASIAYYDNAYGPYYDGYWDGDVYLYRARPSGAYLRDDAHHFRRDRADGFREYRGRRGSRWH